MAYVRTSLAFVVGMAIGSMLILIVQFPVLVVPSEQRKASMITSLAAQEYKASHSSDFRGPSRAYPFWKNDGDTSEFPCVPQRPNGKPVGNLFVGPPKVASSTVGGIMLRISRNIHRRRVLRRNEPVNDTECKVGHVHYTNPAWYYRYGKRDKKKSFLWSFLREPTSRFVSEFFHFQVSRDGVQPTDVNFQNYFLRGNNQQNMYLFTLHPHGGNLNNMTRAVEDILHEYNFIGITERIHESLVVLKLLLGIELNDILYVKSAKGSGGFDDGAGFNNSCVYIVPSFVSPGMKKFFATNDVWKERTRGDMLLYQAANKSLDLTIEALGRDVVERELREFERAMQQVQETCKNITLPCSEGGIRRRKHDCLYYDLACGYKCLESLDAIES